MYARNNPLHKRRRRQSRPYKKLKSVQTFSRRPPQPHLTLEEIEVSLRFWQPYAFALELILF